MSSERVMVELTPDEYMQLRDEAAERSTADAPRDMTASLSPNKDHQIQDGHDDEVVPFAADAGLADQAELASATAASPEQTPAEHDPDPHFDKLATQAAISQRPSGPAGTALIDAPPARPTRRRAPRRPVRTGDRKAPLRLHRRLTTVAAMTIAVVAIALVLERPSGPSATSSAGRATAAATSGLSTVGALLTPVTRDVEVLAQHAATSIDRQEAARRRNGTEHARTQASRRAHARHRPRQGSKLASAQVIKGSSMATTTGSATTETQPARSVSVAPTTTAPASTYTHQAAGPTSLGSQVGIGCDPTCR